MKLLFKTLILNGSLIICLNVSNCSQKPIADKKLDEQVNGGMQSNLLPYRCQLNCDGMFFAPYGSKTIDAQSADFDEEYKYWSVDDPGELDSVEDVCPNTEVTFNSRFTVKDENSVPVAKVAMTTIVGGSYLSLSQEQGEACIPDCVIAYPCTDYCGNYVVTGVVKAGSWGIKKSISILAYSGHLSVKKISLDVKTVDPPEDDKDDVCTKCPGIAPCPAISSGLIEDKKMVIEIGEKRQ